MDVFVDEAAVQADLEGVVERARAGEDIVITRGGVPYVRIVPVPDWVEDDPADGAASR